MQLCLSKINTYKKKTYKWKWTEKAKERRCFLYLASEGHGMLSWSILVRKKLKRPADVWRTERRGNKSNERENGEERQKWKLFKKSNLSLTHTDKHAYANLGTNKQNKNSDWGTNMRAHKETYWDIGKAKGWKIRWIYKAKAHRSFFCMLLDIFTLIGPDIAFLSPHSSQEHTHCEKE